MTAPIGGRRRPLAGGLAIMLGSSASNQVGAGIGAHAFDTLGPAGVVAVRQFVAAAVLIPLARPRFWRFSWSQWWPALALGLVFSVMNLSLYTAIDRIGLGLAVTLEFLGPLAVALFGSRTRIDLACAVAAGAGVYVLVLPGPSTDLIGIALGLLAAGCWASYILLNRVAGRRLPGLAGPAMASAVSATLYLPVGAVLISTGRFGIAGLGYALAAGLFSSVVPYAADLLALRRVPARFFGVVMSVNPVLAALAGMVLLGQRLAAHEWIGIMVVVVANAVCVLSAARATDPAAGGPGRTSPAARTQPAAVKRARATHTSGV